MQPRFIAILPALHNHTGRHDGDWYPVSEARVIAGTVAEWTAYCAQRGLELHVLASERQPPEDVLATSEALADQVLVDLGFGETRGDPRPLWSAERLRDDLYVALHFGALWPNRLSTLTGALAAMLAAARTRPVPQRQRTRAIAEALSWYLESEGTLAGDTCHFCGEWFVRAAYDTATVARMIADGFAARCPACNQQGPR